MLQWVAPTGQAVNYISRQADKDNNAWLIWYYYWNLSPRWHLESIAALCGNIDQESTTNPLVRDFNSTGAFGLVQWATYKQALNTWCLQNGYNRDNGTDQCRYLEHERAINQNYLVRSGYSLTWNDFAYNQQGKTVDYLTASFKYQYEKNPSEDTDARITKARHYYELFQGEQPYFGISNPWLYSHKKPWWKPGGRKYIHA